LEIKDVRSSVDLIRDASKADLIILSLFLLPLLLGGWSLFLNNLRFFDQYDRCKSVIIGLIFVTYVVGLIIMKSWDPREEKLKRARFRVRNILKRRKRASFEAIREEVNQTYYTDKFLEELIDKNPGVFRSCPVKRAGEFKPGITLVEEEEAPEAS
jgi:hypothetical protein